MKTASIRDVRHNLTEVLSWVEDGEEVEITNRGKTVAVMHLPLRAKPQTLSKKEFLKRWRRRPLPTNQPIAHNLILKMREEEDARW